MFKIYWDLYQELNVEETSSNKRLSLERFSKKIGQRISEIVKNEMSMSTRN